MGKVTGKTAKRLEKSLKGVKEWASDPGFPAKSFDQYMSGQGSIVKAISGFFGFYSLGMNDVGKSLLAANSGNTSDSILYMSRGIKRMSIARQIDIVSVNHTQGGRPVIEDLDTATHLMLGAIATGQPELVIPYHNVLFDNVNSGYGIGDGHDLPLGTTLRYAAFGLTIIGDWLGKPLDLDKYALPRDPAWGQLVANWREPDPVKFLPVLLAACDTHIERIALTESEGDSGNYEFSSVFLAVHPTEILAVLRLREMIGLTNPPEIDHPLMQTPYAAITCLPGEVTERDELLENFLSVVRQRDPHVLPAGV